IQHSNQREQSDSNLHDFCSDRHSPLAITVGEIAARHGEKDEGYREQSSYKYSETLACLFGQTGAHDKKQDKVFECVVTERALKLSRDQTPKARMPAAFCVFHLVSSSHGWQDRRGCRRASARSATLFGVSHYGNSNRRRERCLDP